MKFDIYLNVYELDIARFDQNKYSQLGWNCSIEKNAKGKSWNERIISGGGMLQYGGRALCIRSSILSQLQFKCVIRG